MHTAVVVVGSVETNATLLLLVGLVAPEGIDSSTGALPARGEVEA